MLNLPRAIGAAAEIFTSSPCCSRPPALIQHITAADRQHSCPFQSWKCPTCRMLRRVSCSASFVTALAPEGAHLNLRSLLEIWLLYRLTAWYASARSASSSQPRQRRQSGSSPEVANRSRRTALPVSACGAITHLAGGRQSQVGRRPSVTSGPLQITVELFETRRTRERERERYSLGLRNWQ